MAVLAPISGLPRFRNGIVLENVTAFFYDAGTTTPKTVYQDPSLSVAHANPVEVDGEHNFPAIYVGEGSYKIRIVDENNSIVAEYDELQGQVEVDGGGGGGSGTTIPTGFYMDGHTDAVVDGWVRANGRTIGNAVSGASERASADTQALFVLLWEKDTSLTVSGGRGVTAVADFNAGKTLTLPDAKGIARIGRIAMGGTATTLLANTALASTGDTVGARGGQGTVVLTVDQTAPHTHTASTSTVNDHQHAGTTDLVGDHTHGYSERIAQGTTGAQSGSSFTALVGPEVTASGLSTTGAGTHNHTFTTAGAGSHAHTVTVTNTGGGQAHTNLQPSMAVTVYIKL